MTSKMKMSVLTATLGLISFILGVIAENKKPLAGTPVTGKGVVICTYPKAPTVALGVLSIIFLFASSIAGYIGAFKDSSGSEKKPVPRSALFESTYISVFFGIALVVTTLAAVMLIWPTVSEQMHISNNIHHNLQTDCPTAKTGLLGGGAFLSLNSMLFWLLVLMFADNARKDFLSDSLPERTSQLA